MYKSKNFKILTAICVITTAVFADNFLCLDRITSINVVIVYENEGDGRVEHNGKIVSDGATFVLSNSCDSLELTAIYSEEYTYAFFYVNGKNYSDNRWDLDCGDYDYEKGECVKKRVFYGNGEDIEIIIVLAPRMVCLTESSLLITVNNGEHGNVGYYDYIYDGGDGFAYNKINNYVLLESPGCISVEVRVEPNEGYIALMNGNKLTDNKFIASASSRGSFGVGIGAAYGISFVKDPTSIVQIASKKPLSSSFAGISNGQINLQLQAGTYTVELYNLQGRMISQVNINATNGINATGLRADNLSRGVFILNVKRAGTSVLRQRVSIR